MNTLTEKEANDAQSSISALRRVLADELLAIDTILATVSQAQGFEGKRRRRRIHEVSKGTRRSPQRARKPQ